MLNDAEKEALARTDLVLDGASATCTWDMRMEGDISGVYAGTFKFRCYLDPMQQISSNREYRELLGSNPTFASQHESFLAFSLTQLKYRIISAPPFWASTANGMPGNIADENVLSAVLSAATDAELKFKAQIKERREKALSRAKGAIEDLMEDPDDSEDSEEA